MLVVAAAPTNDAFATSLLGAACLGLEAAGHTVRVQRLSDGGFAAVMSPAEHHAYHSPQPIISPEVQRQVDDLRWADQLVFVFESNWAGLPAIVKGWLERVMVPGVAFVLDERTNKVRRNLTHIRRITGVTYCSNTRLRSRSAGDGGRRTIRRALRMICSWRTRTTWLVLYNADFGSPERRDRFVRRVERTLAR